MTVPTSCMIASFSELEKVIKEEFVFPAIGIPFGEEDYAKCRVFSTSAVSEEDFLALLADSYPMPLDGVPRVHFISRPKSGASFQPKGTAFELFVT